MDYIQQYSTTFHFPPLPSPCPIAPKLSFLLQGGLSLSLSLTGLSSVIYSTGGRVGNGGGGASGSIGVESVRVVCGALWGGGLLDPTAAWADSNRLRICPFSSAADMNPAGACDEPPLPLPLPLPLIRGELGWLD